MQIILKAKTLLSNIEGLFEAWFLQLLSFERSLFGFCFNLFMNRKVQNFGQNFKRRIQSKGVGKVVLDAVGGSLCSIFECLCSLFSTTILEKNCWPQQDSNSDCLIVREHADHLNTTTSLAVLCPFFADAVP